MVFIGLIKRVCFIVGLLCLSLMGHAQQFVNNDLAGPPINAAFILPYSWNYIPFTDPNCMAAFWYQATPDLTDMAGPQPFAGLNGNPYSGNSFISGLYFGAPQSCHHEGIMQTVSGFNVGCTYTINFYQSVVKQSNALDTSGGWAVYSDNTLVGTTAPTVSLEPYNSNSFPWEFRSLSFTATNTTHTIKFLPFDDDADQSTFGSLSGALRVGIDSIYIETLAMNSNLLGNDTIICNGQNLVLNVATPGATYQWQDNSTSPTFNATQTGTYWVAVNYGCSTIIDSIDVTFVNTLVNLGNDTVICNAGVIVLDASTPNANTYLWSTNDVTSSITVTQAGLYWVEVNVNNCIGTDSILVSNSSVPLNILGNDTSFCANQNIILDATIPGATYNWNTNDVTPTITVNSPGIYWVDISLGGCTTRDSIQIYMLSVPTINLGNDTTICFGDSMLLQANVPNALYVWQNNSQAATQTIMQSGLYWVEIDVNGCKATDSINIGVKPLPLISLGKDTTLCEGQAILLNASAANTTYLWDDGSSNPNRFINQNGIYWVEVSDSGCSKRDSIEIEFTPLPQFDLGNEKTLCLQDSVILNINIANATYQWHDGSNQAQLVINTSGLAWVKVTLDNCSFTDSVWIKKDPLNIPNIGQDRELCQGQVIELSNSNPMGTFNIWSTGSNASSIEVTQSSWYWLDVSSEHCQYRDSALVQFSKELCQCKVYAPNAFSPNNDLNNDEFRLLTSNLIEVRSFRIFNRWGNVVFESQHTNDISWDGNFKGEPCEVGTYFYIANYLCKENNKEELIKGDITLLR